MPYDIVDTAANGYNLISVTGYYTDFNAGSEFMRIIASHFPFIKFSTSQVLSERTGTGNRCERLLALSFSIKPGSTFYVYCHPTEQGGRALPDEARVQWRQHSQWVPDLATVQPAAHFIHEFRQNATGLDGDLSNRECYVFGIYKRNANDEDVVISAIYPDLVGDKEHAGTSNGSIQYKITNIREAFLVGISATEKGNAGRIIHFKPKHLIWYMLNRDKLHTAALQEFKDLSKAQMRGATHIVHREQPLYWNKIIYGAPGTGKSFELREQAFKNGFTDDRITRVTFHPNYSYQQFIGSYKPSPLYKSLPAGTNLFEKDKVTQIIDPQYQKDPSIDYSFIPGPFVDVLVKALDDPGHNYLLIIEEINRANVAAVFGDAFQLLDRKTTGESEYSVVASKELEAYLRSLAKANVTAILPNLTLPRNLYIWATMNSADQGVMPMDAAFKRRWSFQYLSLNEKEYKIIGEAIRFQNVYYDWNEFREKVNNRLKTLPSQVREDKLIGPFFLNELERQDDNSIKNKLLLYLFEDVLRHNPSDLFTKKTFSDIIKEYDNGEPVFKENILPDQMDDDQLDISQHTDAATALANLHYTPGATVGGIQFYTAPGSKIAAIKSSREYPDGGFWFGITPSTLQEYTQQAVTHVIFVFEGKGYVELPIADFSAYIAHSRTTRKPDGSVLRHHIHVGKGNQYQLNRTTDGSTIDLPGYVAF